MSQKRPQPQSAPIRSRPWIFALILIALVAVAYAPAWRGKPIWDDDAHITRLELRSLDGLNQIWLKPGATRQYYPIVHSVFWLEHALWGESVLPYHLLNILLHALSAFLLYLILTRLKIPGAWLAAAIFALHPIEVESVAWISELKNTLSGVCFFSSALLYLKFTETRNTNSAPSAIRCSAPARRSLGEGGFGVQCSVFLYAFALLIFLLGLLSKSVIATLPAALLVIFWWKQGSLSWRRDVLPLLPFFAAGIVSGLFTAWVERHYIGAEGDIFNLSLLQRCLIAGRAFCFYLFKIIWPARLTFIYPRWYVSSSLGGQYLFPLVALSLLLVAWTLRDKTRAPLAALLIFGGLLFPVLGFFNVYPFQFSFVADHFQYLAGVAIMTLVAAGIALLLTRKNLWNRPAGYMICGALLALLAFLTWNRATLFADPIVLYKATLEQNPDCWMAHNNIGIDLLQRGQLDEAVWHFNETLRIQPNNAEAHTNLGNAYCFRGRYASGIAEYVKAAESAPQSLAILNNLGWLLATCSDPSLRNGPKAVQAAQQAVQIAEGKDPVAYRTLAAAYSTNNQPAEAAQAAQQALTVAGNSNPAWSEKMRKELEMYQKQESAH